MADLIPTEISWNIASSASIISYGTALTYDQLNAIGYTYIDGMQNYISGIYTYSPSIGTVLNSGNQVLSVVFTPDDYLTYASSEAQNFIEITPLNSILNWNNPDPVIIHSNLTSVQLNAKSNVDGSFVYNPSINSTMDVEGFNALYVSFYPTDNINYLPASASVTILVKKNILNDFKNSIQTLPTNPADPNILKNIIYSEYKSTVSLLESLSKCLNNKIQYLSDSILMFDDITYELLLDKLTKLNTMFKSSLSFLNVNKISVNNIKSNDIMTEQNLDLLKNVPISLFNTFQNVTNELIDTNLDLDLPPDLSNAILSNLATIKDQVLTDYIGYYYPIMLYPIVDYKNYLIDNNILNLVNKLDILEKYMTSNELLKRTRTDMIHPNSKILNSIYFKRLFAVSYTGSLDIPTFINLLPDSNFKSAYTDFIFTDMVTGDYYHLKFYCKNIKIVDFEVRYNGNDYKTTVHDVMEYAVSAINLIFNTDPINYPFFAEIINARTIRISAIYKGIEFNNIPVSFEVDTGMGITITNYDNNKLSHGTFTKNQMLETTYISKIHNIIDLLLSFIQ